MITVIEKPSFEDIFFSCYFSKIYNTHFIFVDCLYKHYSVNNAYFKFMFNSNNSALNIIKESEAMVSTAVTTVLKIVFSFMKVLMILTHTNYMIIVLVYSNIL